MGNSTATPITNKVRLENEHKIARDYIIKDQKISNDLKAEKIDNLENIRLLRIAEDDIARLESESRELHQFALSTLQKYERLVLFTISTIFVVLVVVTVFVLATRYSAITEGKAIRQCVQPLQRMTELRATNGEAIILTQEKFALIMESAMLNVTSVSTIWTMLSKEREKVSYSILFSLFSAEVLPSLSAGVVVLSLGLIFSVTGTFLMLYLYSSTWSSVLRIVVKAVLSTGYMITGWYLFQTLDDVTQILGGIYTVFSWLLSSSVLLEVVCVAENILHFRPLGQAAVDASLSPSQRSINAIILSFLNNHKTTRVNNGPAVDTDPLNTVVKSTSLTNDSFSVFFLLIGHTIIVTTAYAVVPFAPLVTIQVLNGYLFFAFFTEIFDLKERRRALGAFYGIAVWLLIRKGGPLHWLAIAGIDNLTHPLVTDPSRFLEWSALSLAFLHIWWGLHIPTTQSAVSGGSGIGAGSSGTREGGVGAISGDCFTISRTSSPRVRAEEAEYLWKARYSLFAAHFCSAVALFVGVYDSNEPMFFFGHLGLILFHGAEHGSCLRRGSSFWSTEKLFVVPVIFRFFIHIFLMVLSETIMSGVTTFSLGHALSQALLGPMGLFVHTLALQWNAALQVSLITQQQQGEESVRKLTRSTDDDDQEEKQEDDGNQDDQNDDAGAHQPTGHDENGNGVFADVGGRPSKSASLPTRITGRRRRQRQGQESVWSCLQGPLVALVVNAATVVIALYRCRQFLLVTSLLGVAFIIVQVGLAMSQGSYHFIGFLLALAVAVVAVGVQLLGNQ